MFVFQQPICTLSVNPQCQRASLWQEVTYYGHNDLSDRYQSALSDNRENTLEKDTGNENLMKSFGTLVTVAAKQAMRENGQIKQIISKIVPASTLSHIEFCRIEGGRMRVTVDSASWIARLRFSERQIINTLRALDYDCHTLSYHVAPAEKPVTRKTIRKANSHVSGASALEQAAKALVAPTAGDTTSTPNANEELSLQMLKLAETMRSGRKR